MAGETLAFSCTSDKDCGYLLSCAAGFCTRACDKSIPSNSSVCSEDLRLVCASDIRDGHLLEPVCMIR